MHQAFQNNPEKVKDYACEDADIALQLYHKFESLLKKEGFVDLFSDIEMPLVKVLASMEAEGVRIDLGTLETLSKELGKQIKQIENKIFEISGKSFNISSPKQLGTVLFEDLQIRGNIKKNKKPDNIQPGKRY